MKLQLSCLKFLKNKSEWTPGVSDGQGCLACCDSWGRKESDTTEQLNWTEGCKSAAFNMSANLENSAVATVLEKVNFHSIQTKGNSKECSTYHAIVLISLASKVMLKILQAKFQHYMNWELPDIQTGLKKQRSNCQHPLDHRESKGIPETHFHLLHWLY